MAALHRGQYPVRTVLHWQVQIACQFRHFGIRLDQAVGEFDRMRSRKTNAINALDFGDVVNQCREVCNLSVMHWATIRIDILSQQIDLTYTLIGETGDLCNNIVERSTDFLTACVRYDAEAAVLAATFHDGYERGWPFRPGFGQSVEFFDFRE